MAAGDDMIAPLSFVVPGQPMSWKRTENFGGRRYTNKVMDAEQKRIALLARVAHHGPPLDGPRGIKGAAAVVLVCVFVLKRPDRLKGDQRVPHVDRPDLSNLIKLVEDALQLGGVLTDDCRIVGYGESGKWYGAPDEEAHTVVTLRVVA